MPCYDSRCSPTNEERKMWAAQKEAKHARGIVCAISHELARRGLLNQVILAASKKGEVDVSSYLKEHWEEDEMRLGSELDQYSLDELGVIQRIINDSLTYNDGDEDATSVRSGD